MSDWRLGVNGHFVMDETDGNRCFAVVTEVRDYVEGREVVPRAPFEVEVTIRGRTTLAYRSTIELAFAHAELKARDMRPIDLSQRKSRKPR